MSGWIAEECGKIVDDSGAFLGRANSDEDAKNLCADHNADCDAYEARIVALTDEIARLTTILYGKPIAQPEFVVGPLMSVSEFFEMMNELRDSAQVTEATASAELAKDNNEK